ncbi:hypothetical protein ACHAXN_008873 [Cyclotella atomus]|jgi:hypothetical protein
MLLLLSLVHLLHWKICKPLILTMSTDYGDEELFKQPPKAENCPICHRMLPNLKTGKRFMPCCSKIICFGCEYAHKQEGRNGCACCNAELPKGMVGKLHERADANNSMAMALLGRMYLYGTDSVVQDVAKGKKLLLRASELGSVLANTELANMYDHAIHVAQDLKKTTHYLEQAAMAGCSHSRYNLGLHDMVLDGRSRLKIKEMPSHTNIHRAIKHWLLACEGGHPGVLECIKHCFMKGAASEADYDKALESYLQYLKNVKSANRDKAEAHNDNELLVFVPRRVFQRR